MAKKVLLRDWNNDEVLPITRGELVLDSSGKEAFRSNEFLATTSQPGLMSSEDKFKIDNIEGIGNIANDKVSQVNTTTSDVYRLLFSETADDETRTEGARKSAKLTFNPSTGVLQTSGLIGNIDGTYVNKLTGYSKATLISDITSEDTLVSALGKVELRAEVAYNLIQGAYDGDGTIENLAEILKVLEGISDTETIQAIVGKYLPLSGGTITNTTQSPLAINNTSGDLATLLFKGSSGDLGALGFNKVDTPVYVSTAGGKYPLVHMGNLATTLDKKYLALTGGTITHMGGAMLSLSAMQVMQAEIVFKFKNNVMGYVGWTGGKGVYLRNPVGSYLGISDENGLPYFADSFDEYTLIHSGNIGSYALKYNANGNVLIGPTTDNGSKLQVNGDISSTNLWPIITISKSLTITSDWSDTGITFSAANFPHGNGSYMVQIDHGNCYFYTGVISVVINDGAVTANDVDEIILHGGGFDSAVQYYLRTKQDASSKTTKIQIATSGTSHTKTINFKFKRII